MNRVVVGPDAEYRGAPIEPGQSITIVNESGERLIVAAAPERRSFGYATARALIALGNAMAVGRRRASAGSAPAGVGGRLRPRCPGCDARAGEPCGRPVGFPCLMGGPR